MDQQKSDYYNGNILLKRSGVKRNWTEEEIQEVIKCKNDIIYFIETYTKIISLDKGLVNFKLYEFQKEVIITCLNNRFVCLMCARQNGKSVIYAAYLLYIALFERNKTIAILANKSATSREILDRIKNMFLHLPEFLKIGVEVWNKGDIKFSNGSVIFAAATTSDSIRGRSCVTGDTKVCIELNNSYYYTDINNILNKRDFIEKDKMLFCIYKTTNKVNNKIYIGFHKINDQEIIKENYNNIGSIFKDGYLGSGKLIKRAIEKYGPESFYQEVIKVFDNRKDAEDFERNLVNRDFVELDDNYNISIGGNVCILYGENNGFYGKTHSEEFKKFSAELHKNNKHFSLANNFKIVKIDTQEIFLDFIELKKSYPHITKNKLIREIGAGNFKYDDEEKNNEALHLFSLLLTDEERFKNYSETAIKNFTGVKRTAEAIDKGIKSHKQWIKDNPEKHKERMEKINKNPEKIKKTAEKHRGMKRTEETRINISNSLIGREANNKGKVVAYDKDTNKIEYFDNDNKIPENYIKGMPKRGSQGKYYTNGVEVKYFKNGQEIPDGWVLGGVKKKRKKHENII